MSNHDYHEARRKCLAQLARRVCLGTFEIPDRPFICIASQQTPVVRRITSETVPEPGFVDRFYFTPQEIRFAAQTFDYEVLTASVQMRRQEQEINDLNWEMAEFGIDPARADAEYTSELTVNGDSPWDPDISAAEMFRRLRDGILQVVRQQEAEAFGAPPETPGTGADTYAQCRSCHNFHGRAYAGEKGANFFCCAMYPYGPEELECPDYQIPI